MTSKKIIGQMHLWLGLASGLVVFVIAITGCVLAFEQEIKGLTQPYRHVKPMASGRFLSPSVLKAKAEKVLSGKKASGIVYNGRHRSVEVGFYNPNPEYYFVAYMNPYSGQVLKVVDEDAAFFHFILHGHYYLWLPEKVGQPVVASATLVFVMMLVSGLILWWPKNKGAAKQRVRINWQARWRRKNYDLHQVLGFYMLLFGLVLSLTGLVWGFQWFSQSFYWATGGKGSAAYQQPLSDSTIIHPAVPLTQAIDRIWLKLSKESPSDAGMYIAFPATKAESILAYINYKPGTYYQADYHFYDQATLKELPTQGPYNGKYAAAAFADKLRRANYDIHVGAILGLPGKILAFLASLICASLPVTGFIIWWGRRTKKRPARLGLASVASGLGRRQLIEKEERKTNLFQSKS